MPALRCAQRQMRRARQKGIGDLRDVFELFVEPPSAWRDCRNTPYASEHAFWMFLDQTLSSDKSCTEAVAKHAARQTGKTPSPDTGAYCKARARLRHEDLEAIHTQTAAVANAREERARWLGRRVLVVDGSTLSMPDTAQNQACYPQPSGQALGCGFPMMRIVAVFSLFTGAMVAVAKGSPNVSERALFRSLWTLIERQDVVLTDRGFCSYAECYLLTMRGVDWVMRNHAKRTVGVRALKPLGKNDRIVQWSKTKKIPDWLTRQQWTAIPSVMTVRELTVQVDIPGFRSRTIIIVTSLLDPKEFPAHAFAQLYRQRWMAELFLRDIKTTMGMDILRCKTPAMIHKELLMYLIAYNLLRVVLGKAADADEKPPSSLSFKTAMSAVRQWGPCLAAYLDNKELFDATFKRMVDYIARAILPFRPDRIEPRAIKRRPKEYDRLNKSRKTLQQLLMQNTPRRA